MGELVSAQEERRRDLLRLYTKVAGQAIAENRRGSITATRIGKEVLEHYGFTVEPFPVAVRIFNKAFVDRAEVEKRLPGAKEIEEWGAGGAWSIGLGVKSQGAEGLYMVTLVRGDGDSGPVIIDLNLPEASNPERGFTFHPTILATTPEMMSGVKPLRFISDSGEYVEYKTVPTRAYLSSLLWTDRGRWQDIAGYVITTMNKVMAQQDATRLNGVGEGPRLRLLPKE